MDALGRLVASLIGRPASMPPSLVEQFPELRAVRLRRGGLPVRIGGWALGQRSAAAITLWNTVFLSADVVPNVELLLHESRHVQQFEASAAFPLRYIWESLRYGYHSNRYEAEADAYAAARLRDVGLAPRRGDG